MESATFRSAEKAYLSTSTTNHINKATAGAKITIYFIKTRSLEELYLKLNLHQSHQYLEDVWKLPAFETELDSFERSLRRCGRESCHVFIPAGKLDSPTDSFPRQIESFKGMIN